MVLTVRYAFLCKIIVSVLVVLQLYRTSLIKISYHVIIRNRCFNIPSAIDVYFIRESFFCGIYHFLACSLKKPNLSFVMSVCLRLSVSSVCLSLRPHGTIVFLLNGFRERLGWGFLLKSVDQIQVLLK